MEWERKFAYEPLSNFSLQNSQESSFLEVQWFYDKPVLDLNLICYYTVEYLYVFYFIQFERVNPLQNTIVIFSSQGLMTDCPTFKQQASNKRYVGLLKVVRISYFQFTFNWCNIVIPSSLRLLKFKQHCIFSAFNCFLICNCN